VTNTPPRFVNGQPKNLNVRQGTTVLYFLPPYEDKEGLPVSILNKGKLPSFVTNDNGIYTITPSKRQSLSVVYQVDGYLSDGDLRTYFKFNIYVLKWKPSAPTNGTGKPLPEPLSPSVIARNDDYNTKVEKGY